MFKLLALTVLGALGALGDMNRDVSQGIDSVFVLGDSGAITWSRMDPIMNSGNVGGHVHQVFGASGFREILNSPEEQMKSECTSVKVIPDKSNYWTPVMYFINQNGTFSPMKSYVRIYYQLRNSTGPITAFPPGMRFVSGLGGRRDPGAAQTQGVELTMDAYLGKKTNRQYLPNGTHHPDPPGNDYIQMNIRFPNCGWANQSLDSDDHFSHMSWPVNGHGQWQTNARTCPESHPINYPQIFIETFSHLTDEMRAQWRADRTNVVMSNGDTTGITWHGDFVAGWDVDVLQGAIDRCWGVGDELETCSAFKDHLQFKPDMKLQNCRLQSQIPSEEIGFYRPLEHLPGCNPVWDWDGPVVKPSKPEDCPWYKKPGWTSPNLQFFDHKYGTGFCPPMVIPGVDTSNVSNLVPSTESFIAEWAKDRNAKENITTVMIGTQAEADKNSVEIKGVNDKPKGYGMENWRQTAWEERVPKLGRIPADRLEASIKAAVPNVKKNRNCHQNVPWFGFPCSEEAAPGGEDPKTAGSAGAGPGGAILVADPSSSSGQPSSSSQPSASVSPSAFSQGQKDDQKQTATPQQSGVAPPASPQGNEGQKPTTAPPQADGVTPSPPTGNGKDAAITQGKACHRSRRRRRSIH